MQPMLRTGPFPPRRGRIVVGLKESFAMGNNSNHKKATAKAAARANSNGSGARGQSPSPLPQQRTYALPDHRLERPDFKVRQVREGDSMRYEISGNLNAPVPPIRESKYLDKKQTTEVYRYMLLNRRMEKVLENLYKQGKVVGGVYLGL